MMQILYSSNTWSDSFDPFVISSSLKDIVSKDISNSPLRLSHSVDYTIILFVVPLPVLVLVSHLTSRFEEINKLLAAVRQTDDDIVVKAYRGCLV